MSKVLEKVWKFIKKYYGYILLSLILFLVLLVSFKQGYYLLSNDNYSPELNPILTIKRAIASPAWRSYRVFGFASETEQADLFRAILYFILNVVFSKSFLAVLYSYICMIVGVFSMSFLTRKIAKDYLNLKSSQLLILIPGIIYLCTLWTAWTFKLNMMPYITQFGFFPLLLYSGYLLCRKWNKKHLIFFVISSVLFTAVSVIATISLVNILMFIVFIFTVLLTQKREIWRGVKMVLIFISLQLFWILPFIFYTFNTGGDIVDSFTNRTVTANTVDLEYQMMDIVNSARFYTRLLGTLDVKADNTFLFERSQDFLDYDFYKVIGLLPIVFAIVGLIFITQKKKYRYLVFYIFLFGALFLIKNKNEPLGGLYVWLQDNIPLFKQVFRWVSSKLAEVYLIFLTITSAVGIIYFIDLLKSFFGKTGKKIFTAIFVYLYIMLSLIYAGYIFEGDLFASRALVKLPNEYYSLNEYINDEGITSERVLYLPPANNGYFREYEWGFIGSQFLGYIIPNPLVDMSLSIGSRYGENAVMELTEDYNTHDIEEFREDLKKYDIDYILVDKSLIKGRYGHDIDWSFIEEEYDTKEPVWSEDFLQLYALEDEETKYVEVSSGYMQKGIKHGEFTRASESASSLNLLNMDLSDSTFNASSIRKEVEFERTDSVVNLEIEDISKLPTTVDIGVSEIVLSPAFPTIDGHDTGYTRTYRNSGDYLALIFGDNVVENMISSRSFYNSYSSLEHIRSVGRNSTRLSLMKGIAGGIQNDCSEGEKVNTSDFILTRDSTGVRFLGDTDLPCVSTYIGHEIKRDSVVSLNVTVESETDSWFGYCFYSSKEDACLNTERYHQVDEGSSEFEFLVPKLLRADDHISLITYIFDPDEEDEDEKEILIQDMFLEIYSDLSVITPLKSTTGDNSLSFVLQRSGTMDIEIPVLHGGSSYYYKHNGNSAWQAEYSSDIGGEFEVVAKDGQRQFVTEGFLNQYKTILQTEPSHKYIWMYDGINLGNIPATVCLTYQGDDKCISANMFDEGFTSRTISQTLEPNKQGAKYLDLSLSSTSFKESTENILNRFLIMNIPESWRSLEYVSSSEKSYSEYEMDAVRFLDQDVLYKIDSGKIEESDALISIPQASAKGWLAVVKDSDGWYVLGKDKGVTLDGWKQGWDISGIPFDQVYVIYWPNILGYFGYMFVIATFIYLLVNIFRKNFYGKK